MRIWHDDIRKPPPGEWLWVRTNEEAVDQLTKYKGNVVELSLDHDLGLHNEDPNAPNADYLAGVSNDTGMNLVDFLCENKDLLPKELLVIHSWNTQAAKKMQEKFLNNHIDSVISPFDPSCREISEND